MSSRWRTAFFGTPAFAVPSFQATFDHSDLSLVITQPDRPRGRGQKLSPCEVKAAALEKNVRVFSPASLRKESEELSRLKELFEKESFDLFVVTAYGNLLPEWVLQVPRFGCVNVHASLLPLWRGAAPIQRSVEAGDRETGVCLQKMVMELDAGNVLAEKRSPLGADETSEDLFHRLALDGGAILSSFLKKCEMPAGTPQDPAQVTLAKKIQKNEGHWDPSWTAIETHNKVRAFKAWPGVRAQLEGVGEVKLISSSLEKAAPSNIRTGELSLHEGRVFLGSNVRTGESAGLVLNEIQVPGKPAVKAADFVRTFASRQPGQDSLKIVKVKE